MDNCETCNANIKDYCGGHSRQCANCWEVERRLADYMRSDKGRAFVVNLIQTPTRDRKQELANVKVSALFLYQRIYKLHGSCTIHASTHAKFSGVETGMRSVLQQFETLQETEL